MIRNRVTKTIRRVTICAIVSLAIVASFPLSAFADSLQTSTDIIENVQDKIAKEAEAFALTLKLADCVNLGMAAPFDTKVTAGSELFDVSGWDYEVAVGPALEKKLTGGYTDGEIKCTGNGGDLVALTATALDVSADELVYGEYVNGIQTGGILVSKVSDDYMAYVRNDDSLGFTNDSRGLDNNGYLKTDKYPYAAHLKKLYNAKAVKEGWMSRYEQMGVFGEEIGYYIYRMDITSHCGLGTFLPDASKYSGTTFKEVSSYGDLGIRVGIKPVQYPDKGFSGVLINNDYSENCKAMVGRANELASGAYVDKIFHMFNDACKENLIKRKEEIEKSGMKLPPDTISQLDTLADPKKTTAKYPYTEEEEIDDPNEGKFTVTKCKDVGGLLGARQEEAESEPEEDEERIEASCYDNSGGIGWLVCPIIDFAGDAIPGMYESFVENSLVLDAGLFATGSAGGAGTRDAWSQILGYANILFIGFFLFVIFSQLTGIGLDNYGIKKVLPKLIIAAILINLSYFICQLAIDLANILGHGIKGILDNIGTIDASKAEALNISGKGAGSVAWASFLIPVLVGLICVGAVLAVGKYLLLVVLMAIISIATAVVSLFIMLAVRKAFAVMLVIVSPLAFLCYMLPNTKPIYQKWFRAFKAVLLAYPICSLVIYGGEAVARLMVLSAGSNNLPVWTAISAAIVGIVPVFFIPKVLKSSMNAISGTIANATNRLGGLGKRKLNESAFGDRMRKNRLAHNAGIRFDENGNVMSTDNLKTKVGKALAGKKGSKRRTAYESKLNTLRGKALNQQIEDTYAGQFVGEGSKNAMNQYLAGGRAKKLSDTIGNTVDAINGGNYMMGDGTVRLNPNDVDQLAAALRQAIGEGGNDTDMQALMSVMCNTENGRQAMRNELSYADSQGTWRTNEDGTSSRQAAGSYLASKQGGLFKQADRTVFDWAQSASVGEDKPMSDNMKTGKLKMDTLSGGDDAAIGRLYNQAKGDSDLQSDLQSLASQMSSDPKVMQGLDANRRTYIEAMKNGDWGGSVDTKNGHVLTGVARPSNTSTNNNGGNNGGGNNGGGYNGSGPGKTGLGLNLPI